MTIGVACGSGGCMLLGYRGSSTSQPYTWTTTDLGASYTPRALPAAFRYSDLDCFRRSCVVAGGPSPGTSVVVLRSALDGTRWSQTAVANVTSPGEVDCSAGTCVVAAHRPHSDDQGGAVLVSHDQGRSFELAQTPPTGSGRPEAVACTPNGARCLASDLNQASYPRVVGTP